jgi:hypothetical protein
MPIEFACPCGKKHRAADEHAGKRAKCSQCGQITVIPAAAPGLRDAPARMRPLTQPATSAPKTVAPTKTVVQGQSASPCCPSCQSPVSRTAVLCVNCGYNLTTGRKTSTEFVAEPESPKPRPPSRFRQFVASRATSWKIWSGMGMMILGALVCFVIRQSDFYSLRLGRSFVFALILFTAGGISFINGLFDGDGA